MMGRDHRPTPVTSPLSDDALDLHDGDAGPPAWAPAVMPNASIDFAGHHTDNIDKLAGADV
jgi:hypothetical protein